MAEILNWYAYVKDKTSLNGKPKALMNVTSFKVGEYLLTTHNSSINVILVPTDVNIGDIVCLYNPYGIVRYMGVIKAIKENEIQLSQMQSFYKGTWVKDTYPTKTTIEEEFAYLLNQYAQGYSKGSNYYDHLQRLEKEPLKIKTGSLTEGNLLTPKDNETIDMEKFIYSLYENYQILLDFNIPYDEWNIGDDDGGSVTIKKPNYTSMKISDNANCIVEISPTTEIAKTNKLIVYSKDGVYRTTFYATVNGIVEEGTSIIGRVGEIDTKVVFSDDELTDIVQANLSEEMFNHKITFTILLDNKLYKYDDFKLGMPVEIVKGADTYNSMITGYEISKNERENVISATFTCGFASTSLTQNLARKLGLV